MFLIVQWKDLIWLQVHKKEVNISKNDSKVK